MNKLPATIPIPLDVWLGIGLPLFVACAAIDLVFLAHDRTFGTIVVIVILNLMLLLTIGSIVLVPRFYYAVFLRKARETGQIRTKENL